MARRGTTSLSGFVARRLKMRVCELRILLGLIFAFAALAITGAEGAEVRASAEVTCRPTNESLRYDCTIKLSDARTRQPLTGITLMVGADMPSMPMAHSVRPVKAEAGSEPGTYRATLELEMTGVWALRLDLGRPLRDRVVTVLRFEDDAVAPASAARPAQKGRK